MVERLLGIDVGTSATKATVMDTAGCMLAVASQPHATYSPQPGWQEQEPQAWWDGVCRTARRVMAESRTLPTEILGLAFTGQGSACVPVDAGGVELGRAIIWTDCRAFDEQKHIRALFGQELGPLTGNDLYDQPEPRMLWLRDHEPLQYERTGKILTTVSYLVLRATGRIAANFADCGFHLSFDRRKLAWNETFLQAVQLDMARLPDLYLPHEIVGGLTRQAAAEIGMLEGTPVAAGGQDIHTAALAAGVIGEEQLFCMRGSTDLACSYTRQPNYQPGLYLTCAALPGFFLALDMSRVVASGASYSWLAHMLFENEGDANFEGMNALAETSPPGSNGLFFLPYLFPGMTEFAKHQPGGAFWGLKATHTRGDLCRSIMEGTAYTLHESLMRLRLLNPQTIGQAIELRMNGGPTRCRLWNQVTADVTSLPLSVVESRAGAAKGAAMLAGMALGIFPAEDAFQALSRLARCVERFEPDLPTTNIYRQAYTRFHAQSQLILSGGEP